MSVLLNTNIFANSYANKPVRKESKALSRQKTPAHVQFKSVRAANVLPYFATNKLSFAGTLRLPGTERYLELLDSKKLDIKTRANINLEATKRITGLNPWPEHLKTAPLNPWMVTAETSTFMQTGGLAMVGVDLPDSFNNKFEEDPDQQMPIVTPLYLGETGDKKARLEHLDNNKYRYHGAEGKTIDIEKVKTLNIKVYNLQKHALEDEKTDIFIGKLGNTDYIFFKNDKFFDLNIDHEQDQKGPYVNSQKGVDEVERFMFLSKAGYELMKQSRQEDIKGIKPPNVIVANDWHAGPLGGLMRYQAAAQKSTGDIDKETADYIKETPVVYIAHNPLYQGWQHENTGKILNTLYEESTEDIISNARGVVLGDRDHFSTRQALYVYDCYNQASAGLNLSDRVVPVSENYADEIAKSTGFGYDFTSLFAQRKQSGTLNGITNGYSKSLIVPDEGFVNKINKAFEVNFKPYNEKNIDIRAENKQIFAGFLENLINGNKKIKGVELYKPEECIKKINNIENIPVITGVGRFDDQKGFDIMAKALEKSLTQIPEGKEKPLVVILGSGNKEIANIIKSMKDNLAKKDPEAGSRILLFEGFNIHLRDTLQLNGDMFAIPSKFEPCGLTQMEAMAKGNLPVTTSTGGLVNTIEDGETGFRTPVFYTNENGQDRLIYDEYKGDPADKPKDNVQAFSETLDRALDTYYNNPDKFKQMSQEAMKKDFSWDKEGGSLDKYINLFRTGKI